MKPIPTTITNFADKHSLCIRVWNEAKSTTYDLYDSDGTYENVRAEFIYYKEEKSWYAIYTNKGGVISTKLDHLRKFNLKTKIDARVHIRFRPITNEPRVQPHYTPIEDIVL